jgi:hypothetical protein
MSRGPWQGECVCGRVRAAWTAGAIERWAAWHCADGCEGCDHVVAIRYDSHTSGLLGSTVETWLEDIEQRLESAPFTPHPKGVHAHDPD